MFTEKLNYKINRRQALGRSLGTRTPHVGVPGLGSQLFLISAARQCAPWEAAGHGSHTQVPTTHLGEARLSSEMLAFAWPSHAAVGKQEMQQQMEALPLPFPIQWKQDFTNV